VYVAEGGFSKRLQCSTRSEIREISGFHAMPSFGASDKMMHYENVWTFFVKLKEKKAFKECVGF